MKKAVSIVAILLVLVAGGLVVGPSFVDWNKFKPVIVDKVEQATGLKVELEGDVAMAVLPSPHARLGPLKVSTSAGETLVSLKGASAYLEFAPLLQKRVVVNSVELDTPAVNLGVGEDGAPNWQTPVLKEKMSGGAGKGNTDAIAISRITIKDGAFTYTDKAKKAPPLALAGINADIKGENIRGPYNATGDIVYNGQPVKIQARVGRVDAEGGSFPLHAEIDLPGQTVLKFSGVAGLRPAPEIQGEMEMSSADPSAALAVAGGKTAIPGGALSLAGMLTAGIEKASLTDGKIVMGQGLEGKISFSADGLKKKTPEAPINVTVALEAAKPVNLDTLLPPAAKKEGKPSFLPLSMVLPTALNLKADMKAPSVTFKGGSYTGVSLSAAIKDKTLSGALSAQTPGKGSLQTQYTLSGDSSSVGDKGQTTLADLKLDLSGTASIASPKYLADGFLPKKQVESLQGLLLAPVAATFKASVTPVRATFDFSSLKAAGEQMALAGSVAYEGGTSRQKISLKGSATSIDADALLEKLKPTAKVQAQPAAEQKPANPQALAETLKGLDLPFDLATDLSFGSLTLKQESYRNVVLKGSLIRGKLALDSVYLVADGGNSLNVAGTVGNIAQLKDVDLTIEAKTPDLQRALDSFKIKAAGLPPRAGPAEVLAEFKGQPDRLGFVVNLKAMKGTLETSGTLADVLQKASFSGLTFRLRHPNYVELARLWQPAFKSSVTLAKDIDLYVSMERTGKISNFKGLQANIGPASIAGTLSVDQSGARPKVTAQLSAGDLPLSELLGVEKKSRGTVARGEARWPRTPINIDWMNKFDGTIGLSARSLTWQTWQMSNPVIKASLAGGVFNLSQFDSGLYGGKLAMVSTVNAPKAAGQPLSFQGQAKVEGVDLESLVGSFSGAKLIQARGMANLDAALQSAGVSMSDVVNNLAGRGTVTGRSLIIEGFDLARISRTLVQPSDSVKRNLGNLLESSLSGGQTAFDTLDSAYTIKQGVMTFDKLALAGPSAGVGVAGNINLPLWTMDLESTVKLAEPKDAPPLKTTFRGPLDAPAKSLGRSALDSYIGNQVKQAIGEVILENLGDKKKDGAKGLLQDIIKQQIAPQNKNVVQPTAPPPPVEETAPAAGAEPALEPQQPMLEREQPALERQEPMAEPDAPALAEPTPEEAVQDLLQNLIEGQ